MLKKLSQEQAAATRELLKGVVMIAKAIGDEPADVLDLVLPERKPPQPAGSLSVVPKAQTA